MEFDCDAAGESEAWLLFMGEMDILAGIWQVYDVCYIMVGLDPLR
jgi:hypothetical protein